MIRNILEYAEETARRFPDKTASATDKESMAFSQLVQKAKEIGTALTALEKRNAPIAVMTEKTPAMVAAFLGVVYSGNFYTPIDTTMPKERIQSIFQTLAPAALVIDEKSRKLAENLGFEGRVFSLEEIPQSAAEDKLAKIRRRAIDTDPLYALFTSGSTGVPKGVVITDLMSVNDFLYASIAEVIKTLIEAIILVVLIVYLFLQDVRSTLIPTVSIFVALIGTFGFLAFAGFTINLLTLFALVLAIGTVVDDAIIVVEAVQARFDVGYKSSYHATIDAMSGITSAIISSTLVFMAVFIPVSMMGGTSGTFYTQFGITMAVAVGLSAVNALTLSPALCALILKPYLDENGEMRDNFAARFRKAFNAAFSVMIEKYKRGVLVFIKHRWLMWSTLVLALGMLFVLMNNTKTGLVPDEDQGVVMVNVTAAPGSSLAETNTIMEELSNRLSAIPQIRDFTTVAGYGMIAGQGSSYGMCIVRLKDWEERPEKSDAVNAVIGQIYARTADIKDAQIFAIAPPMIAGYGTSTGLSMHLQDRAGGEIEDFYALSQQFIGALNQRPEIAMAYSTFNINFPQYIVDIDAAKAKRAGISTTEILSTLSGYYGGQYVSYFNRFSKVYRVIIQADPKYRLDTESLNNVFVRMSNGEMAPISQYVKLTKTYGSEVLNRFNMYSSIAISGMNADGYSSGDVINAVRETAAEVLPHGYGYEFDGITREESQTTNNTVIIFGICILLIYLILSALYESFIIPFAVILSVPIPVKLPPKNAISVRSRRPRAKKLSIVSRTLSGSVSAAGAPDISR